MNLIKNIIEFIFKKEEIIEKTPDINLSWLLDNYKEFVAYWAGKGLYIDNPCEGVKLIKFSADPSGRSFYITDQKECAVLLIDDLKKKVANLYSLKYQK